MYNIVQKFMSLFAVADMVVSALIMWRRPMASSRHTNNWLTIMPFQK